MGLLLRGQHGLRGGWLGRCRWGQVVLVLALGQTAQVQRQTVSRQPDDFQQAPDMAMGGGTQPQALPGALSGVAAWVESRL